MNVDQIICELNDIKISIDRLSEHSLINDNYNFPFIRTDGDLVRYVKREIRDREIKRSILKEKIFSDPSWDIILELFHSRLIARCDYISTISTIAGVPSSTGLRHIGFLNEIGFVEREDHISDRRRVDVRISNKAFETIKEYFIRISQN
jgi:DNA-binding MarR family transcriptional regulator